MKIFPAIDIKDKKCVRLIKGDFDNKTEYETSPIDQAQKYKDYGFKNLHIVDLDGALSGETVNLDVIEKIVSKFDLKIEIGGGVRTFDSIQKYIDFGAEKLGMPHQMRFGAYSLYAKTPNVDGGKKLAELSQ